MNSVGVYVHIPFCIRKCNYCDFCSYTDKDGEAMRAYSRELCRRIEVFACEQGERTIADTVYFGGGTPTLLPIDCFELVMDTLHKSFHISSNAEITAECNPASIGFDGLKRLRELGINRLSIGLQSANDNELRALGRVHGFKDFCDIYTDARKAGFDNLSVDLMYGIPKQTVGSFEKTLSEVIRLAPEHVSAYGLKIEQGTAFSAIRDELALPDEDEEYKMYSLCADRLGRNGYNRYEISNFAKDGRESRHNLRYWRLNDYVGFGVAAHSCFNGERFGNSRDMNGFLAGKDITEERYAVSDEERRREYVMLGLRLGKGIDTEDYKRKWGRAFKEDFPVTDSLVSGGFLCERDGHIAFTTKGFFVSNAVLCEMLDFG